MWNWQSALFGLLCLCSAVESDLQVVPNHASTIYYLDADGTLEYKPATRYRGILQTELRTYCYRGTVKSLGRLFETIELLLEIDDDDYTQYDGETPQEVEDHYDQKRSMFSFNLFSRKKTRLQLSPFKQRCIGIETEQPYRVRLHQIRVDFWRVAQLVVGLTLFLAAERLSHNAGFFYMTGVALGICSSFMLLIWLVGRLVPRRPMMYGVLLGGWTVGLYIIQLLWGNLQVILLTYRTYVLWYMVVSGLLSFFFCYRVGPPKNKRSKTIIKWVLQLMSLLLIYFSSPYEEASISYIIMVVVYLYFPRVLLLKLRAMYVRRFPPKRRLLTNEEYYEEGARETSRALDGLRSFASSPDCKQWKIICKLRDPLRFAAFVEGSPHLHDEEILMFESSKVDNDADVDDSDLSANEQEENSEQSGDNGYIQRRHVEHRRFAATPFQPRTRNEQSEDSESNEGDEGEVATTSYSARRASFSSNSRRSAANGGGTEGTRRSMPYFLPEERRLSAQRIPSRSARMVASAQRNRSARSGGIRSFEMQQYSDESEE